MEAVFTLRRVACGLSHFARVALVTSESAGAEVVSGVDMMDSACSRTWIRAAIDGVRAAIGERSVCVRITDVRGSLLDTKVSTVWCAAYIATLNALGDDSPQAVFAGVRWTVRCGDGSTAELREDS